MGFPPGWKNGWKKKHDRKKIDLHLCKLETYTYISLATIYELTAITKILVAGWKHASFLCYSMGARWFLRILGPKLELPSMSAYSPYLRRLWQTGENTYLQHFKCWHDVLLLLNDSWEKDWRCKKYQLAILSVLLSEGSPTSHDAVLWATAKIVNMYKVCAASKSIDSTDKIRTTIRVYFAFYWQLTNEGRYAGTVTVWTK